MIIEVALTHRNAAVAAAATEFLANPDVLGKVYSRKWESHAEHYKIEDALLSNKHIPPEVDLSIRIGRVG